MNILSWQTHIPNILTITSTITIYHLYYKEIQSISIEAYTHFQQRKNNHVHALHVLHLPYA